MSRCAAGVYITHACVSTLWMRRGEERGVGSCCKDTVSMTLYLDNDE